jgi:hypothetical protein
MSMRIMALARNICRSRKGGVAIMMGFISIVMIGMSALGVEMGFAYYKQRQMQAAADAAAFGAGIAIAKGYPLDFRLQARALTAAVGYVDGGDGVSITVNKPPATGAHAADQTAVEVLVSQPQTFYLVTLFRSGLFTIRVRAVAIQNQGSNCVLALNSTASGSVTIKQNGILSSGSCGVGANSSSETAVILEENARINGPVSVHGNYTLANGAALSYQTPPYPKIHAGILPDPYATVNLDASGATSRDLLALTCTTSSTCNLLPGRYDLGLNIPNNRTVNFATGVYYIGSSLPLMGFTVGNNVTLNANPLGGVTLVINGNYGIVTGTSGDVFNLTAPTTGPTAGLALVSLRTVTTTQKFSNNVTVNLKGAIYLPKATIQFDNNSTLNTPFCGQLIADKIQIQNNADLKTECIGAGTTPIGGSTPQLVE